MGIKDINGFLHPNEKYIEDPHLFENIDTAKNILVKHLLKNHDISLLVDCDCDGYSSASIIYQYIKNLFPNINIKVYIHNDKQHGLRDVIDEMIEDDSKLIIVPDAGTGDKNECNKLHAAGKEVLILDHHDVSPQNSLATIVNNQLSSNITDKAMTGVGIVYKFIKVLDEYFNVSCADSYLDLVAFGMIGDRADVTNLQTRFYVLNGLKQLRNKEGKNLLLKTFVEKQMYSMNYKITINGIGFYVCPLMNSLIRFGSIEDKRYMFEALCNSNKKIYRKVQGKGDVLMSIQEYVLRACESSNRKQKNITEKSSNLLIEQIENHNMDKLPIIICNAGNEVDANSTGLIANRLADVYQRPCLLMRKIGNVCKGSGRGSDKCEISNFNEWCKNTGLFDLVEGHANAFGSKIKVENTGQLIDLIHLMPKINEPTYLVYGEYNDKTINDTLIKNIAKHDDIWGNTVNEPLFCIKEIRCNKHNVYLLGKKQNRIEFMFHNIKFVKMTKGSSLLKVYKEIMSVGETVKFTIIGKFQMDYKKKKSAQVTIEDWTFEKSEIINIFGV